MEKLFFAICKKLIYWYQKNSNNELESLFKECGEGFSIHNPYSIFGIDQIKIGNRVKIGAYIQLWGNKGIEIGDDCLIASHVTITSLTHNASSRKFSDENVGGKIIIGNNVWIGTHSIILPGISIGDNCIIGAGTLVNKDVPNNSVITGSPGKLLKIIS